MLFFLPKDKGCYEGSRGLAVVPQPRDYGGQTEIRDPGSVLIHNTKMGAWSVERGCEPTYSRPGGRSHINTGDGGQVLCGVFRLRLPINFGL